MPFEAAKAIAATFCYHIRYALTPVFGLDFLSLCILPEDPSFGRMIIGRDIVRQCTEVANGFRELSIGTSQVSSPQTPSSGDFPQWPSKSLRRKPVKILSMDNGYGTDTDLSDKDLSSPQTPVSMEWTALNKVTGPTSGRFGLYHQPASTQILTDTAVPDYSQSRRASSCSEESRGLKRSLAEKDEDYDEDSHSTHSSEGPATPLKRRKKSTALTTEAKAAYMLMQLSMKDATLGGSERLGSRRRASS